jgi:hypothetical protein
VVTATSRRWALSAIKSTAKTQPAKTSPLADASKGLFLFARNTRGDPILNKDNVMPITTARLLYDRKEAARQLSISVRSLDYLIASKELETRRIGKKVLVPHGSLVRFAHGNHYTSPKEMAEAA